MNNKIEDIARAPAAWQILSCVQYSPSVQAEQVEDDWQVRGPAETSSLQTPSPGTVEQSDTTPHNTAQKSQLGWIIKAFSILFSSDQKVNLVTAFQG